MNRDRIVDHRLDPFFSQRYLEGVPLPGSDYKKVIDMLDLLFFNRATNFRSLKHAFINLCFPPPFFIPLIQISYFDSKDRRLDLIQSTIPSFEEMVIFPLLSITTKKPQLFI